MLSYFNILTAAGKLIFPSLLWKHTSREKIIYLTFDDGPIPQITPWVLKTLKLYNAKASFFCIGDNVSKHPDVFQMILDENHTIGNHSYNHLNGWKTNCSTYVANVVEADSVLNKIQNQAQLNSQPYRKLFRPPYGRIKSSQIKELKELDYKIVMWDVISGDYDEVRPPEKCLKDVKRFAGPGSIIVFHDSLKAYKNLQIILPEILEFYSDKGFEFRSL